MGTNKNERGFTPRQITICGKYLDGGTRVPDLRLMGQWLMKTVFGVGKRVEITYVDEKLVISLAKEQPEWVKEREEEANNSG